MEVRLLLDRQWDRPGGKVLVGKCPEEDKGGSRLLHLKSSTKEHRGVGDRVCTLKTVDKGKEEIGIGVGIGIGIGDLLTRSTLGRGRRVDLKILDTHTLHSLT